MRRYLRHLVALLCLVALFAPTQLRAGAVETAAGIADAPCPFHAAMQQTPVESSKIPACCTARPQHDPTLASAAPELQLHTPQRIVVAIPALHLQASTPTSTPALSRPPPRPVVRLRI